MIFFLQLNNQQLKELKISPSAWKVLENRTYF